MEALPGHGGFVVSLSTEEGENQQRRKEGREEASMKNIDRSIYLSFFLSIAAAAVDSHGIDKQTAGSLASHT